MKHYTTKEAAAFLKVDRKTIQRYRKAGILVPDKFGANNTVLYSEEQLIRTCRSLLSKIGSSGDMFLKKKPQVATCYQAIVKRSFKKLPGKAHRIRRKTTKMIVPCDKLSQIIWNWTPEEFAEYVGKSLKNECLEGKDKFGNEIVTPYWLGNAGDYADLSPLTAFQREILFYVISLQEQGCKKILVTETSEGVTGDERGRALYDEIYDAFEKLAFRWIEVDLTPLLKARPSYKNRYNGKRDNGEWKLKSPLLPCRFLKHKDKNSRSVGIELLAESPLMIIAQMKRQVLTYDAAPLAIANQNHTERVTVINQWLLRNVEMRKRGHLDSNKILLKPDPKKPTETFYVGIGLADGTKRQKQQAREDAAKFLNHLKEEKVIRGWSWEMDGTTYRAIILDYDKAAQK